MARETAEGRHGTLWRLAVWTIATATLLLVPLIAMRITDEVAWSAGDFVFFGALLLGTGILYELAARARNDVAYRAAVGVALAATFILIWVNGAVGIIGSEDNPANLMYGGVLAVGILGVSFARQQPRGTALALLLTAIAQALAAVIALIGGWGATGPNWPLDVMGLTGFFTALWLTSAWLFRKAAQGGTHAAG